MDLDAEAAVLSTVMLSEGAFDEVAGVVSSPHFYSEANRRIFEAVATLSERGSPVDYVTVAAYLKQENTLGAVGGLPYLTMLTDAVPAVANVTAYASIVRDRWQARRLIQECNRWAAEAYTSSESAGVLLGGAEAAIAELSTENVGNELERVSGIIAREAEKIEELRALGEHGHGTGLSTGFAKFDELTSALQDGDVTIVAGRPGMGKSAFAMNIAANVARPPGDVAVAAFSLEMPKAQLAVRLACAEAGVPVSDARKNKFHPDDYLKFRRAVEELQMFNLWIDDTPAIGLFEIRARVRKLERDITAGRVAGVKKLGLVVVDYLQLMRGIRQQQDSREREVASLSSGLKSLAKDFRIPVIALSQLNRNPEHKSKSDRRPQLSDLRESGAIEQDADNVVFLYREDYYDKKARPGDAEAIVAKQRNGPPGTVYFHFKGAEVRFYERAEQSYDDLTDDFAEDR
jgi:replicative DNA helicase